MNSNNKFNQGGYIRSYLIVAIVLVVALSLTIVFVKNRAEQARRDQAIAIVNDQEAQKKQKETDSGPVVDSSDQKPVVVQEPGANQPDVATTKALPKTGPSDTYQLFMLSILVGLFVSFIRSRSMLKQPL